MHFISHIKWALLWSALIFILCVMPGEDIPFENLWDMFSLDKLIHASLFYVLVLLFIRGFSNQNQFIFLKRFPVVAALIISIPYGGILEFLQGVFLPDRSADLYDFIANSFGALSSAAVAERKRLRG